MTGQDKPPLAPVAGCFALALLPHLAFLPWPVLACCAGLWAYAFHALRRERPPLPKAASLALLAAIFGIGLLTAPWRQLVSLGSCSALLAMLLALKTMEMRTRQDLAAGIFISLFLVVLSLLDHPGRLQMPYLALVGLADTAVLVRLHTGGGQKRVSSDALLLFAKAIPVALVLFLLFPRLDFGLDREWGLLDFQLGAGARVLDARPSPETQGGSGGGEYEDELTRDATGGSGGSGSGSGSGGTGGNLLQQLQRFTRGTQVKLLTTVSLPVDRRLLLLLVLAMLLLSFLILNWRLIWALLAPPPDPVQHAYLKFCSKLARAGLPRLPSQGPLDYAATTLEQRPDLAPEAVPVFLAYINLRYGSDPSLSARDFKRLVRRFSPGSAPR